MPCPDYFEGFDHVAFWVTNAKQAVSYYVTRFGFDVVAYKGLETGSRDVCTWVIRQNKITMTFSSPLNPVDNEMTKEIARSGDFIRDVAFTVSDCEALYKSAIEQGGVSVSAPQTFKDEDGEVVMATIQTYGNVQHTFVERKNYNGTFLPGYKTITGVDPINTLIEYPHLEFIDHVVGNQDDNGMQPVVDWYEKVLGFHQFWSVDDTVLCTDYSSLRSVVVASPNELVKMPINEPAPGKRKKSQIKEYVEYHGHEGGVQHVALTTNDILHSIDNLRKRGVDFLYTPPAYYENLRARLAKSPVQVKESLDEIEKLGILVDFDDQGYLLQLFTKPVEDRPTLFFEIIQRRNHNGFGAGNFKALFESIEREQEKRGNLV